MRAEQSRIEMIDLANYAKFLLADEGLVNKLMDMYYEQVAASNIPLLQESENLSRADLKSQTSHNIKALLRWIARGECHLEAPPAFFEDWQSARLNGIKWEGLALQDVIGIYDLRRSVLVHFLPVYTSDIKQLVRVSQQLGTLFNRLREKVIQAIIDLQQQELYKEKEFSNSLINNSINGILSFDNELLITEFNKEMERWLNLRKADVLGKSVFDVFPLYRGRQEEKYLADVLKGKRVFISERPLFAFKDRYFEANLTPFYNQEHTITGGLAIIYETTNRKHTERLIQQKNNELAQALAELKITSKELQQANEALEDRVAQRTQELVDRENFLNSIIEQSPVSTWITDAFGTLLQLNKASLELFRSTDASIQIRKGQYNILQDEEFKKTPHLSSIQDVFRKGVVARFSLEYQVQQLSPKQVSESLPLSLICTIFPIKDKQGKVTNAVVQHEDVTEIRKAEQALKQSNEELRLIADALPVLISYIDQDRVFRFINKEYERWYLKSRNEILNKPIWEVIGEAPYQNISPLLSRALAGERVQEEITQDYGASIGIKHISATLVPHVVNRKVAGIFALVTDISIQKKNEQMLEALYEEASVRNEELKRINVDLDNFVYSASHDLKSPIVNLEGLLSLVVREIGPKVPERDKKLVDLLLVSLNKLKKTIEDLIGATRLKKQGEEQFGEEVVFEEVIRDVKDDLQQMLRQTNAQLLEQYHASSLHYARSHLRSILYNLLSNALKYRSPDRQLIVEIETSYSNHDILLRIKDNGLGMTPEQQEKLFSMFTRMHTHVEGTGIGLYTIKRIIENKGGTISVHSEAGRGTEFLIYFNQV